MSTPAGFKCKCGKYHKFTAYVMAHWNVRLDFTCEKCGRKLYVLRGHAVLLTKKQRTNPNDNDD